MSLPKGEMLRIERAPEIGFCFGVRRAVTILEKAALKYGSVETLGAVVHNQLVVERLAALGVRVVEDLNQLEGNIVAISSHGTAPQVLEEIRRRQLHLVDTTCPRVRKAQKAVKELADAGFKVIIFGDTNHPEVKGLLGWSAGKGVATLDGKTIAGDDRLPHRLGILSQTTRSVTHFAQFVGEVGNYAIPHAAELRVINTICSATTRRQKAALKLAGRCDLMLVVGARNSSNTQRLAELCSATGVETHLVEAATEIKEFWLRGRNRIGITAGASTPDQTIEEVVLKLELMTRGNG